jgi:hypothetical protein
MDLTAFSNRQEIERGLMWQSIGMGNPSLAGLHAAHVASIARATADLTGIDVVADWERLTSVWERELHRRYMRLNQHFVFLK